jgi:uncharacterized coiled-coil protein SlyX
MTPEEHERLTRLEEKVGVMHETIDEVRTNIVSMRADFNKAKGVLGGVLFTISALWAFFVAIARHFKE